MNKLGRGPLGDALHTKYQGSMPRRYFHVFFFCISLYVKHVNPGRGRFSPQEHNLNKLGGGPLGDVTYQISRLYAMWFQTRRFFHVFPI